MDLVIVTNQLPRLSLLTIIICCNLQVSFCFFFCVIFCRSSLYYINRRSYTAVMGTRNRTCDTKIVGNICKTLVDGYMFVFPVPLAIEQKW